MKASRKTMNFAQKTKCVEFVKANAAEFTGIGERNAANKLAVFLGVPVSTSPIADICEAAGVNFRAIDVSGRIAKADLSVRLAWLEARVSALEVQQKAGRSPFDTVYLPDPKQG